MSSGRNQATIATAHVYGGYADSSPGDKVLAGASTIIGLMQQVSALVPQSGPLSVVFGAAQQLIAVVAELKDNRDECEHLLERILLFISGVAEELRVSNVVLVEGSSTAARLQTLLWNIIAIKADTVKWKGWGTAKRLLRRADVKSGLRKHGQNLTDCFLTFSIRSDLRIGAAYDEQARNQPATEAGPGAQTSVLNETYTITNDHGILQDLLSGPVTQPMFSTIAHRVAMRVETLDAELATISSNQTSYYTAVEEQPIAISDTQPTSTVVRFNDPHTDYLISQLSALSIGVYDNYSHFMTISTPAPFIEYRPRTIHTGPPVPQLRQTIRTTLDLLDLFQDNTISTDSFAEMLFTVTLGLTDLGLCDEALSIQTVCTALLRDKTQPDPTATCKLARSIVMLSICILGAGKAQEAIAPAREAVALLLDLPEQNQIPGPDIMEIAIGQFSADYAWALHTLANALSRTGEVKEASSILVDAIAIRRKLVTCGSAEHLPALASSLNTKSFLQFFSATQLTVAPPLRTSEASNPSWKKDGMISRTLKAGIVAADEACRIYRQLAGSHGVAYHRTLAAALMNLSACAHYYDGQGERSDENRMQESLAREEERDAFNHMQLEASRGGFDGPGPSGFMKKPNASLKAATVRWNLASETLQAFPEYLADDTIIQTERALAASFEAVSLLRTLVLHRPKYNSELACALINLSLCLSKSDLPQDYFTFSAEAVELLRSLDRDTPVGHQGALADGLAHHATLLLSHGQYEAAFGAAEEAISKQKRHPWQTPANSSLALIYLHCMLIKCLNSRADDEVVQRSLALHAAKVLRSLLVAHNAMFAQAPVDMVLINKIVEGLKQAQVDNSDIDRLIEIVNGPSVGHVYIGLSPMPTPMQFESSPPGSPGDRHIPIDPRIQCPALLPMPPIHRIRQPDDSVPDWSGELSQRFDLWKSLAEYSPDIYQPRLVKALTSRSFYFSASDPAESLRLIEEGVKLSRELSSERDAFKDELALMSITYASRLFAVGREEDALSIAAEAEHMIQDFLDSHGSQTDGEVPMDEIKESLEGLLWEYRNKQPCARCVACGDCRSQSQSSLDYDGEFVF